MIESSSFSALGEAPAVKNADGFVQHFPLQLALQAFENAQVGIDGARRVYDALEEGNHPGKEVFEDKLVNKHTEERLFVVGGGEGCLRLWLWAPGIYFGWR